MDYNAEATIEYNSEDSDSTDLSLEIEFDDELHNIENQGSLQPYRFEPEIIYPDSNDTTTTTPFDVVSGNLCTEDRMKNLEWCSCEHCNVMASAQECVCCHEHEKVFQKIQQQYNCICNHPGFEAVCLNPWVLETAYYNYRQHYGCMEGTQHEKFRYIAYRQLVRWCWGWLGKNIRIVLPACAVEKIRKTFPSDSYVGFNLN